MSTDQRPEVYSEGDFRALYEEYFVDTSRGNITSIVDKETHQQPNVNEPEVSEEVSFTPKKNKGKRNTIIALTLVATTGVAGFALTRGGSAEVPVSEEQQDTTNLEDRETEIGEAINELPITEEAIIVEPLVTEPEAITTSTPLESPNTQAEVESANTHGVTPEIVQIVEQPDEVDPVQYVIPYEFVGIDAFYEPPTTERFIVEGRELQPSDIVPARYTDFDYDNLDQAAAQIIDRLLDVEEASTNNVFDPGVLDMFLSAPNDLKRDYITSASRQIDELKTAHTERWPQFDVDKLYVFVNRDATFNTTAEMGPRSMEVHTIIRREGAGLGWVEDEVIIQLEAIPNPLSNDDTDLIWVEFGREVIFSAHNEDSN